jgi:hypothetical protein
MEKPAMSRQLSPEELKLRLDATKASQERTRIAFFANTLIGLCLLAVFWNGYLSIYKNYVTDFYIPSEASFSEPGTDAPKIEKENAARAQEEYANQKKVQAELMQNWVSSRFITVSLLGIKIGVGDAPELGAIAVSISLVWFLFVVQRENHTIGSLLQDALEDASQATLWSVYHGVLSYTVFTHADVTDRPIRRLSRSKLKLFSGTLRRLRFIVVAGMHLFPIICLCGVLAGDILVTLAVWSTPFRIPQRAKLQNTVGYWSFSGILIIIDFVLWGILWTHLNATERVLREYCERVREMEQEREKLKGAFFYMPGASTSASQVSAPATDAAGHTAE